MPTIRVSRWVADQLVAHGGKDGYRIEYCRGSGKGGQNRNKLETACKVIHLATGVEAYSCDQRSQLQNRNAAVEECNRRVVAHYQKLERDRAPERDTSAKPAVRHYTMPGTTRDARLPGTTWRTADVLDGDGLAEIIQRLQEAELAQVEAMVEDGS